MKILIIDNHALFRAGLRHILRQLHGGAGEILEAESFAEGLKLAGQHPAPDLVLLELKSPGSEGAIAVRNFRQRYLHIPLVVVSSEEDCGVITRALNYGASGYLRKNSTGEALLGALKLAISGGIYVPAQVLQKPVATVSNKNNSSGNRSSNSGEHNLTARQIGILKYLADGLSNKEIAAAADLGEGTVKVHVAAIFQRLRVKTRMEAVLIADQLGLTDARDNDIAVASEIRGAVDACTAPQRCSEPAFKCIS